MNSLVLTVESCEQLAEMYEYESPEKILEKAVEIIPNLALASSFGAEDMVLLDVLMKVSPSTKVFYLDTQLLFPETYELIERAVQRYGIPNLVQVKSSLSLNRQAQEYGDELWKTSPDRCCNLRKVQPLTDILATLDGWVTGIRRNQTANRANAQVFEEDQKFQLIKVNPLVRWTHEDVWDYIHSHSVPYNPLHEAGYPSIGCVHCTLPVKPGEDPRSGRWAGQTKTECGLHLQN